MENAMGGIKVKVATLAVRTAEVLVRLKERTVRQELRRATAKLVHVKQVEDAEAGLVEALEPLIREQVEAAVKRLGGASGDDAEKLADQIFDPADWDAELIDRTFPSMATSMGEAALSVFASFGVDARKSASMRRKHLPGQHDQSEHGRGGGPKTKPGKMSERTKSEIAKSSAKYVGKEIQNYAKKNEHDMAKKLGGKSFPDSEPVDVEVTLGGKMHGIEMKTMVDNKHDKVTMKADAMARKRSWAKKNKGIVHTVVMDDEAVFNAKGPGKHDPSKRKLYYRRGFGSWRVRGMHEVKGGLGELKNLMQEPKSKLPKGAR